MPPSADQFSGCLLGQCLGDALGFPVEGHPPEDCVPYADALRKQRDDFPFIGRPPLPFGQYTDDSQLAREWMQSYAARGCFDPEEYAARIQAIFAEKRIVGEGFATWKAARRLAQGIPWRESGMPAPDAGNGTAMRAGPVGIVYAHDLAEMIRVACEQSWITHQDPRCAAGAVAIAGAVALAARPGAVHVEEFARRLSEWVGPVHRPFAVEILRLNEWVARPPREVVEAVARSGDPDFADGWKWISPYVVPSVLWSLYSFLRAPEDYWEAICTSIEAGGDVDTTAAMTGAIIGAHLGAGGLPAGPLSRVTDRGTWGQAELGKLAHHCHQIAGAA